MDAFGSVLFVPGKPLFVRVLVPDLFGLPFVFFDGEPFGFCLPFVGIVVVHLVTDLGAGLHFVWTFLACFCDSALVVNGSVSDQPHQHRAW